MSYPNKTNMFHVLYQIFVRNKTSLAYWICCANVNAKYKREYKMSLVDLIPYININANCEHI